MFILITNLYSCIEEESDEMQEARIVKMHNKMIAGMTDIRNGMCRNTNLIAFENRNNATFENENFISPSDIPKNEPFKPVSHNTSLETGKLIAYVLNTAISSVY